MSVTGTSVAELRVEMNRSQLFIRPKRDLMLTCTPAAFATPLKVSAPDCLEP